jgi:cation diffusion facilitator CzcD-associated flavoprotein CzcO
MLKDGERAKTTMHQLAAYMCMKLQGNESLREALIPKFSVGCRRLTPGIGYLEALQAANARVITDRIDRVVPQGIQTTAGETIEVDAIVCATGFDVSFCPRFPVVGPMDNLQDRWRMETPKAYMSCAVPGMPNYFSEFLNATYPTLPSVCSS